MDGIELVPDHRVTPPREEAIARPAKPRRRGFAALTVAAITLVTVLFSVYYISARRDEPQESARPTVNVVGEVPTPEPSPVADAVQNDEAAPPSGPRPSPSPSPAPRQEEKRSKRPEEKKAEPGGADGKKESKEKESKVGSILKKTGNILKKPFKF